MQLFKFLNKPVLNSDYRFGTKDYWSTHLAIELISLVQFSKLYYTTITLCANCTVYGPFQKRLHSKNTVVFRSIMAPLLRIQNRNCRSYDFGATGTCPRRPTFSRMSLSVTSYCARPIRSI